MKNNIKLSAIETLTSELLLYWGTGEYAVIGTTQQFSDQQMVYWNFTQRLDHEFISTDDSTQNIFCLAINVSECLAIFLAGVFSGYDQSRTCPIRSLYDR
jgi:hypothetical protein